MDEPLCQNTKKYLIQLAFKVAPNEINITSPKTKQTEAITLLFAHYCHKAYFSFVASATALIHSIKATNHYHYKLTSIKQMHQQLFMQCFIFCTHQIWHFTFETITTNTVSKQNATVSFPGPFCVPSAHAIEKCLAAQDYFAPHH